MPPNGTLESGARPARSAPELSRALPVGSAMTFVLSSTAFANGEAIPARYARWGDNVSPPLRWEGAPEGTRSFALILDDPNAPFTIFRHWAVYDIPVETSELAEGASTSNGAPRPRFPLRPLRQAAAAAFTRNAPLPFPTACIGHRSAAGSPALDDGGSRDGRGAVRDRRSAAHRHVQEDAVWLSCPSGIARPAFARAVSGAYGPVPRVPPHFANFEHTEGI